MSQPAPWMESASRSAYVEHLRSIRIADREMARVLRDAAIEGERIIARTLGDNVSAQVRRAQLSQSVEALRLSQAELWGEVTRATQAGIVRASAAVTEAHDTMMVVLLRAVDENALGGRAEAEALLRSMRTASHAAAEDVRSRLINNIRLSDQVYRTRALATGQVERAVNRGIALQKSAREIAQDVRHMIRPDTPGGVSYAARRLARTEINNAFHGTSIRQAVELPWTEGMKWNLSGSHPRPDECDDYAENSDGLGVGVFKPQDVPAKPHPQCLCYVTTVAVSPSVFNDRLVAGDYDNWLTTQGYAGVAEAV